MKEENYTYGAGKSQKSQRLQKIQWIMTWDNF